MRHYPIAVCATGLHRVAGLEGEEVKCVCASHSALLSLKTRKQHALFCDTEIPLKRRKSKLGK